MYNKYFIVKAKLNEVNIRISYDKMDTKDICKSGARTKMNFITYICYNTNKF